MQRSFRVLSEAQPARLQSDLGEQFIIIGWAVRVPSHPMRIHKKLFENIGCMKIKYKFVKMLLIIVQQCQLQIIFIPGSGIRGS